MTRSTMHGWARFYAGLGWHVFPLVPGTKSPFKGSEGSKEATTDLAQIDKWWSAHPEANIATRPSSAGFYVYDVDPRNGGSESHAALESLHGPVGSPLTVDSPGGGFHAYMLAPQDPTKVYETQPAPGVDGKYNGYAVLPPSLHPNGRRYAWRDGVLPGAAQATAIPQWLVREKRKPQLRREGDRVGNKDDLGRIEQALSGRDPEDYRSWIEAIASIKHWEDTTPDAEGLGFEVCRQWSAQSPKHDDGQFEDKWGTWDSFKDGARTVGSLFHEAGMTAAQRAPDAGAVFSSFPPVVASPPQPIRWTTEPVAEFKGSRDPVELVTRLMAVREGEVAAVWNDPARVHEALNWAAWVSGSNCEAVLGMLQLRPGFQENEQLRSWISHCCATCTSWDTVGKLTAEQVAAGALRVEVDDGKWVSAERSLRNALPSVPGLFKRDGELVFVDERGRIGRHNVHTLSSDIEAVVRLEKGGKGSPAKMPEGLAKRILDRSNYPAVGEIRAAVPLSVVRPDGSVAFEQGLDAATGLYVVTGGRPAQVLAPEALREAVSRVWQPFSLFPYADEAAKATTFAAMLTSVSRAAMGSAPAFIVNAQTPGTGKTLLSEAVLSLTGERVGAVNIKEDKAEQGKQITAILDTGPLTVLFDNVIGQLKATSDLCSALTSPVYTSRILGQSKTISLVNRAVWFLNGNNVTVVGDMNRRILPINLDSGENPERRRFEFDPTQVVRENLESLRSDLINILATYRANGMATQALDGLASFEQWNRLVRGCVLWLGWADPLMAMQAQQAQDPVTAKMGLLMAAWEQRFGTGSRTVREATLEGLEPALHTLWGEAMDAICTDGSGKQNPNRLAYFLRDIQGRKHGGKSFRAERTRENLNKWQLE